MIGPVVFQKGEITGSSSNKNVSRNTVSRNDERTDFIWGCINEEIRHECEQKKSKHLTS